MDVPVGPLLAIKTDLPTFRIFLELPDSSILEPTLINDLESGTLDHELQHYHDLIRRLLIEIDAKNRWRVASSLGKELNQASRLSNETGIAYKHIWTEVLAYLGESAGISVLKTSSYRKHYDIMKSSFPSFEAYFEELDQVLNDIQHFELRKLTLAQLQNVPFFQFLDKAKRYLAWQRGTYPEKWPLIEYIDHD